MTGESVVCLIARIGYAARGIVYLLIGGLAGLAAMHRGEGQTTGPRGALARVHEAAWGRTLLVIIGVGLLAYALWRLAQALLNVDGQKNDLKGITVRVAMFVAAIVPIGLAAWIFTTLWTGHGEGEDNDAKSHEWIAWTLGLPGGRVVVIVAGLIVIGTGIAIAVKGWRSKFEERLDFDYRRWPWARAICRFGLLARGGVFGLIGGSLLRAAYHYNPDDARGMGTVLGEIQRQPWGSTLLAVTALGLVAFGFYGLIEARYRKIDVQLDS